LVKIGENLSRDASHHSLTKRKGNYLRKKTNIIQLKKEKNNGKVKQGKMVLQSRKEKGRLKRRRKRAVTHGSSRRRAVVRWRKPNSGQKYDRRGRNVKGGGTVGAY